MFDGSKTFPIRFSWETAVDVLLFLEERTQFLRQFFAMAAEPFVERKRKIEQEEEPFVPPYSEDSEPAFITEWLEADDSLHVLAYSCVSMLAGSLHLYFESWVDQSGVPVDKERHKKAFKLGKFAGYKEHFVEQFGIDFDSCPADLNLLEEIILARNVVQHPPSIASNRTRYADSDFQKLRKPFFLDERETKLLSDHAEDLPRYLLPTVHVSKDQLFVAINETEKFARWFEGQIAGARHGCNLRL